MPRDQPRSAGISRDTTNTFSPVGPRDGAESLQRRLLCEHANLARRALHADAGAEAGRREIERNLAHELEHASHPVRVHLHVQLGRRNKQPHPARAGRVGDSRLHRRRDVGVDHLSHLARVRGGVEPQVSRQRPVVRRARQPQQGGAAARGQRRLAPFVRRLDREAEQLVPQPVHLHQLFFELAGLVRAGSSARASRRLDGVREGELALDVLQLLAPPHRHPHPKGERSTRDRGQRRCARGPGATTPQIPPPRLVSHLRPAQQPAQHLVAQLRVEELHHPPSRGLVEQLAFCASRGDRCPQPLDRRRAVGGEDGTADDVWSRRRWRCRSLWWGGDVG
mmetsp:Transcript_2762/g.8615  ORF Transcript_2762/g.8615 Transcript_2762/m.8615 type:complete len:337 (+) Transcript_2762:41-1051(+)